jgi:hypothetical protein
MHIAQDCLLQVTMSISTIEAMHKKSIEGVDLKAMKDKLALLLAKYVDHLKNLMKNSPNQSTIISGDLGPVPGFTSHSGQR